MNVKGLFGDDEAVSPVIGVILMVAITVILAAVIASFVLGLGEDTANTSPQASFNFEYTDNDNDNLTITHQSGDTINAANFNASVSGAMNASNPAVYGNNGGVSGEGQLFGQSGEVAAGNSDLISAADFKEQSTGDNLSSARLQLNESTVRLVYNDPSTDSSSTLRTWTGPDA